MPMIRPLLSMLACLVLTAGVLAPGPAQASDHNRNRDRDRGHDRDRDDERSRDDDQERGARRLSLDEAMAQAEKRYKARAVHGEERRQGDRLVYRIRLLDKDGRVFEVSVDAGSSRDK